MVEYKELIEKVLIGKIFNCQLIQKPINVIINKPQNCGFYPNQHIQSSPHFFPSYESRPT